MNKGKKRTIKEIFSDILEDEAQEATEAKQNKPLETVPSQQNVWDDESSDEIDYDSTENHSTNGDLDRVCEKLDYKP